MLNSQPHYFVIKFDPYYLWKTISDEFVESIKDMFEVVLTEVFDTYSIKKIDQLRKARSDPDETEYDTFYFVGSNNPFEEWILDALIGHKDIPECNNDIEDHNEHCPKEEECPPIDKEIFTVYELKRIY